MKTDIEDDEGKDTKKQAIHSASVWSSVVWHGQNTGYIQTM